MPAAAIGILVFEDVEVLDFCGPFEVFSTARPPGQTSDESALFRVVLIAQNMREIHCRGGLRVLPDFAIATHPPLDVVVIPGGWGTRRERSNRALLDWITGVAGSTPLTTSVCTGAFLLAAAGLLDGRRATTHWASLEWMRNEYPRVDVLGDVRFMDEGSVITAAGVSAGIDMALHVVARLHGIDTALWTARRMEYAWTPTAANATALY